jgi:hypothetical protein
VYAGSGNVDGLHKNFRFKKMHHWHEDRALAVGCGHVCLCLSNGFGLFGVLSAISSIKNDFLPIISTYFLNQKVPFHHAIGRLPHPRHLQICAFPINQENCCGFAIGALAHPGHLQICTFPVNQKKFAKFAIGELAYLKNWRICASRIYHKKFTDLRFADLLS